MMAAAPATAVSCCRMRSDTIFGFDILRRLSYRFLPDVSCPLALRRGGRACLCRHIADIADGLKSGIVRGLYYIISKSSTADRNANRYELVQ